jgi:hypothetical protein
MQMGIRSQNNVQLCSWSGSGFPSNATLVWIFYLVTATCFGLMTIFRRKFPPGIVHWYRTISPTHLSLNNTQTIPHGQNMNISLHHNVSQPKSPILWQNVLSTSVLPPTTHSFSLPSQYIRHLQLDILLRRTTGPI